jgi:hypothetical protein
MSTNYEAPNKNYTVYLKKNFALKTGGFANSLCDSINNKEQYQPFSTKNNVCTRN